MKELIKIDSRELSGATVQTCSARELHKFLNVKTAFNDWISRRIGEYGFVDGTDFCSFLSKSSGGRPSTEYSITLDMGKELAMVERNSKGKEVRQYFIECERIAKSTPALNPANMSRLELLKMAIQTEQERLALEHKVEVLEPKAEALDRIADAEGAMNPTLAAKTLQVQPKKLFEHLREKRWIYRRAGGKSYIGYQDKIQAGYITHKVTMVHREDGTEKVVEQVLITAKGLAKLSKIFASA